MPESGLEQRVARLEGRVEGFDDRFTSIERRLDALDGKVDRFREELGGRIETLRGDLGGRLEGLDRKVSRQFIWTVGVQVAVLLAVVAALAGR